MNFSSNGRKRFPVPASSTPSPSPINTKGFNYTGNLSSGTLLESCFRKTHLPNPQVLWRFFRSAEATGVGLLSEILLRRWFVFPPFLGRSGILMWWGLGCLVLRNFEELEMTLVLEAMNLGGAASPGCTWHSSPPTSKCVVLGRHLCKIRISSLFLFFCSYL